MKGPCLPATGMAGTWNQGTRCVRWGPPVEAFTLGARDAGRASAGARLACDDVARRIPWVGALFPGGGCGWVLLGRRHNETPGGTGCPPTGAPAATIARDRRSAAGPVAAGLAVVGPVSRDLPGDCSPSRFGSECRPPRARFRIDVRSHSHKGLVHQLAGHQPDLSTNAQAPWPSVEKSCSADWRAQASSREVGRAGNRAGGTCGSGRRPNAPPGAAPPRARAPPLRHAPADRRGSGGIQVSPLNAPAQPLPGIRPLSARTLLWQLCESPASGGRHGR